MMQKLMEINDHLVRTLAECEQLRSDQKTLQEVSFIRSQRIAELQTELRKAYAERDEAVEHAGRLQAELDATRKQLRDVCSAQSVESAGQSDLARDVSHYIEAAEVDTPVESQPVPVREGRWRTRKGEIRDVIPTPDDDERATKYPWYDAKYDQTWQSNGRYYLGQENERDLVEYVGPLEPEPEPQPEPKSKPYTFAAYIVGDKIQPDALRIVWATEDWIEFSKFSIVHRISDLQFSGNDTFTPDQFSVNLKVQ